MNRTITLIATDNIGRQESLRLRLPDDVIKKLQKAQDAKYPDGSPCSSLLEEVTIMIDDYNYGYRGSPSRFHLSRFQYNRLRDFFNLIYHKFYNYTLTMKD